MLRALQRYGACCVAASLAAAILYVAPASSQEKAKAGSQEKAKAGSQEKAKAGSQEKAKSASQEKAKSASQEKAAAPAKPRQLSLQNEPWTGDFDQMLERRIIRVLAPYSRTLYYVDKGHERGITAELVREFESYVNRRYAKQLGKRPLTVFLIPTTRDKLLAGLAEGRGDIAAGNLTATEERLKLVDFAAPQDRKPVRELIVTGPASPPLATLDDLSGKTVHVRKASSYYESVAALNDRFKKERKAPVKVVELPDALEDEDALEMLAAGLFELAVVDDWKALLWARILPKIKVREDLVLRAEGHTGWAIRKGSPKLAGVLTDFYRGVVKKQGVIESRLAQTESASSTSATTPRGRNGSAFEATVRLFEKYGAKYEFDPLMLTAQGYQESRLRQDARSHVGAIGVMQIMPDTGKELRVGDIHQLEPNIHGGAKYMDQLMTRYFRRCELQRAGPDPVRVRQLQRRPGGHLAHAPRGRKARARSGQVVRQRRGRRRAAHRHGDHDLRAQHLQVLRGLQAGAGRPGGRTQGAREGNAPPETRPRLTLSGF